MKEDASLIRAIIEDVYTLILGQGQNNLHITVLFMVGISHISNQISQSFLV